jgi:hypothetical protein
MLRRKFILSVVGRNGMNVVNMIDDYAEMCDTARASGNFIAYKQYTEKYPDLFGGFLKYFYMTDIDNLQPFIEQFDFDPFLVSAKENINNGIMDMIVDVTKQTVNMLDFNSDYDLYIGIDPSVAGAALPNKQGNPYIYIGIDRVRSESDVEIIVPHELNHMVRCAVIRDIDMFDFTERVVAEGLGTYCPVALFYNNTLTIDVIKNVFNMNPKKLESLINNRAVIEKIVASEFGTPLTAEKMNKYFMWMGDDAVEYPLSGYFIGMFMIHDLISKGYKINELTKMPSQDILQKYTE